MIELANNDVYSKWLLTLNFEKQEIHYLYEANIEMTLPKRFIKRVIFTDSVQPLVIQYNFQSGFIQIENQDEFFIPCFIKWQSKNVRVSQKRNNC